MFFKSSVGASCKISTFLKMVEFHPITSKNNQGIEDERDLSLRSVFGSDIRSFLERVNNLNVSSGKDDRLSRKELMDFIFKIEIPLQRNFHIKRFGCWSPQSHDWWFILTRGIKEWMVASELALLVKKIINALKTKFLNWIKQCVNRMLSYTKVVCNVL